MGHHQLTQTHREILASLIAGNLSIRRIAGILGYAPSSISRELKRNSGKDGKYQADMAQRKAVWRNTKDKKASRRTPELVAYVQEKLRERWSPEQIAGRLRLQAACLNLPLISFKTIYRWIQKDSDSSKVRPFGVWEISSSEAARKSLFQAHQVRCSLSARFAGHRRPPRRQYLWSLGMRSHTWSSAFRLYPDGCGTQKRLSHGCILPDAKRGVRLFLPEGAVFLRPRTLSAHLDL